MRKWVSRFIAKIYHFLVIAWQASYRLIPGRIKKVDARVISIGNITWGGTGKTPLVAMLSRSLMESGKKVVILTRGYGKDEVEELQKKVPGVPILVGRDRIKSAREAVKKHQAEFLILDDGFQHIRLHRDIDVVNINATQPFGPGGLIPAGTLREPLENLSRASFFILTKSDIGSKNLHWIKQKVQTVKKDAVFFEAVHKPVQFLDLRRNRFVPLSDIKNRRVATLCGIADPYSFEKTVEKLGAEIPLAGRFDDHHEYTETELIEFSKRMKEVGVKDILTTEKDFHRIEPILKKRKHSEFQHLNFLVLEIEFELNDEEEFLKKCMEL